MSSNIFQSSSQYNRVLTTDAREWIVAFTTHFRTNASNDLVEPCCQYFCKASSLHFFIECLLKIMIDARIRESLTGKGFQPVGDFLLG